MNPTVYIYIDDSCYWGHSFSLTCVGKNQTKKLYCVFKSAAVYASNRSTNQKLWDTILLQHPNQSELTCHSMRSSLVCGSGLCVAQKKGFHPSCGFNDRPSHAPKMPGKWVWTPGRGLWSSGHHLRGPGGLRWVWLSSPCCFTSFSSAFPARRRCDSWSHILEGLLTPIYRSVALRSPLLVWN